MKKESKEMLKTIISNQMLIMKALKIEAPAAKVEKPIQAKEKKLPAKKVAVKRPAKKTGRK